MADRAAELVQLSSEQHGKIQANSELIQNVLRRLVAVAIQVAPPSNATSRVVSIAGRGDEKSALVDSGPRSRGTQWISIINASNVS